MTELIENLIKGYDKMEIVREDSKKIHSQQFDIALESLVRRKERKSSRISESDTPKKLPSLYRTRFD